MPPTHPFAGLFKAQSKPVPAATDAQIAHAESELGITLPAAYKQVLRYQDGGYLRLTQFELTFDPPENSYARRLYNVKALPSVRHDDYDNIMRQTETLRDEWEAPEGYYPLFGDGHWWCCLDYRSGGPHAEPIITHIDLAEVDPNEPPQEVAIAPSFAALLAGLRMDPENRKPARITLNPATSMDAIDTALTKVGMTRWKDPGGYPRGIQPPPAWEWPKYRSFVKGFPARVELWTNKLHLHKPLFAEPHAILQLYIAADQEQLALDELLEALQALGTPPTLLHGLQ